jgi:hypothetical protein
MYVNKEVEDHLDAQPYQRLRLNEKLIQGHAHKYDVFSISEEKLALWA